MKTGVLMVSSAAFMALLGLAATFLPHEILSLAGSEPGAIPVLIVQVAGALYFSFAILNWMAKGVTMGGIYSRPLAMGNFMHFAIVSIALIKFLFDNQAAWLAGAAVVYVVFAGWFAIVLFTHPGAKGAQNPGAFVRREPPVSSPKS